MSRIGPLWISEAETVALMNMPKAISAVTRGLMLEASGKAVNMTKTHGAWDSGTTIHAVGIHRYDRDPRYRAVLDGSMVMFGAHINAVGAIVPGRYELSCSVFERASMVVTDSIAQARELSSEMIDFIGGNQARWSEVRSLSSVVESKQGRPQNADITIFKSLGIGLADLALAIEVYQQALQNGSGQKFEAA